MSLITKFGIDIVEIRESDFWTLPKSARCLITTYAVPLPGGTPGHFRFELAEYRWDEINAAIGRELIQP